MKAITYSRQALKDMKRHGNMTARIRKAIVEFAANPAAHANNVRLLVGSSAKRLRVGDFFRVIFEERADTILVTKIGPRGGIYDE